MANKANPFPNSFIGEFPYTVDARGRTNFPAPFRHALSRQSKDRLVIARGLDPCIYVFPRDVWEAQENQINNTPYSPQEHRMAQRHVYYGARESGFDAQGRITIPQRLLQMARIDKDVLIVGQRNWVEIWNPEIYEQSILQSGDSIEPLLKEMYNRSFQRPGGSSPGDVTNGGRSGR
jgi:MraZ protein